MFKKSIAAVFSCYHWCLSLLGAIIYLFPSRKLIVIGVTGTKGKTTTIALLSDIFEAAGQKTAYTSSATIKIGRKIGKNRRGNSMPGRFFLKQFMHKAYKAGCRIVLIEVTSEGIIQHRHEFIGWDGAVFLNIHPEHIERHGSFENYLYAKALFFKYVAAHHNSKRPKFFANGNDKNADVFMNSAKPFEAILFFAEDVEKLTYKLPLALEGGFNKTNIAAAATVAKSFSVSEKDIVKGIENFGGVEGRMDVIVHSPFTVVADYAHTPDSLEAVYKHWKGKTRGELVCVLGSAGGGRDKWKRPKLGEVAARYCDYVVLTNEDPYDEDPIEIISDIKNGILSDSHHPPYCEIVDRQEAIETALSLAHQGDVVVCTGKGSEEYIHIAGGKKVEWSESEAIRKAIRYRNPKQK